MKLFLSSNALPEGYVDEFVELVGKPINQITIAHIYDAADPYPEEGRSFVDYRRQTFTQAGAQYDDIHLSETDLSALDKYDVIWLGGGNTFYLRYVIRTSGLEQKIKELAQTKVIAGDSAGAIVVGPTLKHFELADDPNDAPEVIWEGLGLIDLAIVPHWQNPKYGSIMKNIKSRLEFDDFVTKPLVDAAAVTYET